MFERYTEKARRVIFFGRYEASQFGSPAIESEHLLLGLLREDKALVHSFKLPEQAIRSKIQTLTTQRDKVPTSVDLPLTNESKKVLVLAAEEAERLEHKHIGTGHLLLGLLGVNGSLAELLLREHGLVLEEMREQVRNHLGVSTPSQPVGVSVPPSTPSSSPPSSTSPRSSSSSVLRLRRNLAAILLARQKQGGITVAEYAKVGERKAGFAVYLGEVLNIEGSVLCEESEAADPESATAPLEKISACQHRIRLMTQRMEHAILQHEFEKARLYSDEERKEREMIRQLREQYKIDELPPAIPYLCIDVISGDDRWTEVQDRTRAFLDAAVAQVWLLTPGRRALAYTATATEGLREFRGESLRTVNPELEISLSEILA